MSNPFEKFVAEYAGDGMLTEFHSLECKLNGQVHQFCFPAIRGHLWTLHEDYRNWTYVLHCERADGMRGTYAIPKKQLVMSRNVCGVLTEAIERVLQAFIDEDEKNDIAVPKVSGSGKIPSSAGRSSSKAEPPKRVRDLEL